MPYWKIATCKSKGDGKSSFQTFIPRKQPYQGLGSQLKQQPTTCIIVLYQTYRAQGHVTQLQEWGLRAGETHGRALSTNSPGLKCTCAMAKSCQARVACPLLLTSTTFTFLSLFAPSCCLNCPGSDILTRQFNKIRAAVLP